jgi:hypothetical protein
MNPLAIVSLVTGILSIICCGLLGLPLGIAGLVTGFLAKKQIQESGGVQGGDPLALAGMITGGIGVVLSILTLIFNASYYY